MRILLVSPMLPEIGGVSVSSERLRERLQSDGHDVRVYRLGFGKRALNNRWMKLLKFLLFPLWVIIQPRFDIIHGHVAGVFRKRYLVHFKPLYHGAKLILSIHGDAANLLHKPLAGTFRKTDLLICVQPGDALLMSAHYHARALDIPAFILPAQAEPGGIPASVIDFVEQGHSVPLMIASGGVVLTEQFYDLYGLRDAVDLYRELRNGGLKVRLLLVIIGGGWNAEQKQYVDSISNSVADDPDAMIVQGVEMPLMPLFKSAALFLRPTKTDGDALSVREALALGCNVLASDVSVRPAGVVTYHGREDMLKTAVKMLSGKTDTTGHKGDFYPQIVDAYEQILA